MLWIFFALLSAVFAALVAIFGKIGLGKIDTGFATFIRSLFMAGFLFLAVIFRNQFDQFKNLDKRALAFIVFSGLAGALSWFFYFAALKLAPATKVAAIDRLSIVFVLILAVLFLGDKFTAWMLLGVALVVVGSVLVTIMK